MVFATLFHQVNIIITINAWLFPVVFCHTEPPGELYLMVLYLIISGGFCHTEPPVKLYFMILCLIISGSFCHTEPPGELYFLVLSLFTLGSICHAKPPEYGVRVPNV